MNFDLTSQDISHNKLTALPGSFSALSSLRKLNLSSNVIASLPNLSKLSNLIEFDAHNNEIVQLPDSMARLTLITRLDLRHNRLRSLPPLVDMKALREMYLGNNDLSCLDGAVLPPGLHVLDVRDNHMQAIDEVDI